MPRISDWSPEVPVIRALGADGKTLTEIAAHFHITQPHLTMLCKKYGIFASRDEYGLARRHLLLQAHAAKKNQSAHLTWNIGPNQKIYNNVTPAQLRAAADLIEAYDHDQPV